MTTESRDRLAALRQDLESSPQGFDFNEAEWREAGGRALEIAIKASTRWDARRPGPAPEAALDGFIGPLPERPVPLDALLDRIDKEVLPASAFNGHPRWFAYITASPTPVGVLGSLTASALNQNVGLWRATPAASAIERQTLGWLAELLGMPESTEGIFVSGGQMANIVAHTVIRDTKAPWEVRAHGLHLDPVHGVVCKSIELGQ